MRQNPIIVALDVPSASAALDLVRALSGCVAGFKVGSELFTAAGPDIVREIRALGGWVFLDLKFHDIPNTVAKAVASAAALGARMLTVHTGGGGAMLRAAMESARETAGRLGLEPPLVLGVTVLTSMEPQDLREIGWGDDVGLQVERLARLAVASGIRGLVCSPLEIERLRRIIPSGMELVTPGIRSGQDAAGDQKRTLSASEALRLGASWLVVGRPIYAADNPREAAQRILESLN
jgi:orotidine-5'-phosphate decarboxylase